MTGPPTLLDRLPPPEFYEQAACHHRRLGVDAAEAVAIFFTTPGASNHRAKRICAACPVRDDCLDFFINEPVGTFAGTTPHERRALRRARRGAA